MRKIDFSTRHIKKMTKKFNVILIKPINKNVYQLTIEAKMNGYWPINDWIVTNNGKEIRIYGKNPEIDDADILSDEYIDYIEEVYDMINKFNPKL